jgi:hypothetical protein
LPTSGPKNQREFIGFMSKRKRPPREPLRLMTVLTAGCDGRQRRLKGLALVKSLTKNKEPAKAGSLPWLCGEAPILASIPNHSRVGGRIHYRSSVLLHSLCLSSPHHEQQLSASLQTHFILETPPPFRLTSFWNRLQLAKNSKAEYKHEKKELKK